MLNSSTKLILAMTTETIETAVQTGCVAELTLKPEKHSALVRREESAEGSTLHLIPECANLDDLLLREKRHMAAAFRIFAKLGFADGASGHISLRGTISLCDSLLGSIRFENPP